MFSNKKNVNILTSLLLEHGVEKAVVCPGSRNAPIVHNLNECESIECYPVTDERSAGFYAMGMAQATEKPVVVCVTSGSALLNLAPAVAEAYYQKVPIIVISADRPAAWIDQLDGQTLPQPDALGRFVKMAVTLPEPKDDEDSWYCNRLVNEVLLESVHNGNGPVHINVPISEPLFDFDVESLPKERAIVRFNLHDVAAKYIYYFSGPFCDAKRPMIIIGQGGKIELDDEYVDELARYCVMINEPLSSVHGLTHFDEVLHKIGNDADYMPDFIIYLGDMIVSKRVKKFLRQAKDAEQWRLDYNGKLQDTFMNLTGVVEGDPTMVLNGLTFLTKAYSADDYNDDRDPADYEEPECKMDAETVAFHDRWMAALNDAATRASDYEPAYSQMAAVKYFEQQLEDMEYDYQVHYANSTAVRLANIYADHFVWCNRGVNGIEGSLSTAAGFSTATDKMVFCVIGDLSFFYDQNALWNRNLHGNLRIILLNNRCGGIFHQLRGLDKSPARDTIVSACHNTEAQGICTQNDVGYIKATNMEEMQIGMVTLLTVDTTRPMLLEVLTNVDEDEKAYKEYYNNK